MIAGDARAMSRSAPRRRRIGMREHEARHAIGERRLADAGRAADQPGVRDAAAFIGIEQRLFGLGVAEQHRPFRAARAPDPASHRHSRRHGRPRRTAHSASAAARARRAQIRSATTSRGARPSISDAALRFVRREHRGRPRAAFREIPASPPRSGRRRRWPRRLLARARPTLRRHVEDEREIGPGVADRDALEAADQRADRRCRARPDRRGSNRRSGRRSPMRPLRARAG